MGVGGHMAQIDTASSLSDLKRFSKLEYLHSLNVGDKMFQKETCFLLATQPQLDANVCGR